MYSQFRQQALDFQHATFEQVKVEENTKLLSESLESVSEFHEVKVTVVLVDFVL